jgi:hypothetical protein
MKPVLKSSLLACSMLFALAACAPKSNNDPVANARVASTEPDLQDKIFRGQCSLKPLQSIATGIATGGDAAIKSAREQYQVVGANITHTTSSYATLDCSGPETLVFNETGTVSINAENKSADLGKSIDIKMNVLKVRIGSDAGALIANGIKLCGAADWAASNEREVTANSADATCYRKLVPSQDANIYRLLDANTLVFGKKDLLDRNDTRPDTLDQDTKYIAN